MKCITRIICRSSRRLISTNVPRSYQISLPPKSQIDNPINIITPGIRQNPFSSPPSIDLLHLPLDTKPNPLLRMSKEQLMNLKRNEYIHLNNIPYGDPDEMQEFAFNVIEIVKETILDDSRLSAILLGHIRDSEVLDSISLHLKREFQNDDFKRSILQFILDPSNKYCERFVYRAIISILNLADQGNSASEVSALLLNYLRLLARTESVNVQPWLMRWKLYERMIEIVPASKIATFYSYLVNINLHSVAKGRNRDLKEKLLKGSIKDRFIARTGYIDPSAHILKTVHLGDVLQNRMIEYFTVEELKKNVDRFTKLRDPATATLYLNMMISKFEKKCMRGPTLIDTTSPEEDVQSLLKAILGLVMRFKGARHSIKVLSYMNKEGIKPDNGTYLILLENLRQAHLYDEALLVLNRVNLKTLENWQKAKLLEEIMWVVKRKYPRSPKVLIGYAISLFKGTDPNENETLRFLDELYLVNPVYGSGEPKMSYSLEMVQKANVSDSLCMSTISPQCLSLVYGIILRSIRNTEVEKVQILFQRYLEFVKNPKFGYKEDSDAIVGMFVSRLLKDKPNQGISRFSNKRRSRREFRISKSQQNYLIAKSVFEFYKEIPLVESHIRAANLTLLIRVALLKYNDYAFAAAVMRYSREHGKPMTFAQAYPFIKYHYMKGEDAKVKLWYEELVRSGALSNSREGDELFKMVKKLGLPGTKHAGRRAAAKKNQAKIEAMRKIESDPLLFLGETTQAEDDGELDNDTEDLISGTRDYSRGFESELAKVLNEIMTSEEK
ncbi:uncharacterized protein J8A68_001752 [[Candida] subhashii]|uniref:Uncharacterized protein n=1 Tax=[Candida] subhashii TaxID=561895 RepID=A0A8J5URK7_9ASCO|nr:uncharacterized protein J8A68_001752 [[Candida] subhashii]KAG7664727.1 hypothetical protein J8A68_001752 [[Candida] subhashii]